MEENAVRMRSEQPDQFHSLIKMHLSFLLDLKTDDCDCSFIRENDVKVTPRRKRIFSSSTSSTPKRKKKKNESGIMDGVPLTEEGVCQIFQIIEYLSLESNISTEGIFRKHGSLKKQQSLKERLNRGIVMNLNDGEFSVHECAAVFKTFLSELPEPLLTDAYYFAHIQVRTLSESLEKRIQCLQLLFCLIPSPNYHLLKDTLFFLHRVSQKSDTNRMTADNLGTIFSTHILCPRKLSPESLRTDHKLLSSSVSFMITHAPLLFSLPSHVMTDIHAFWNNYNKVSRVSSSISSSSSVVVNTVYSFVDRERTQKLNAESSTDAALAELYAHVQSLPESASKKKLVQKLNDANGRGTPTLTPLRHSKFIKKTSEIKSYLTPRRSAKSESYSFSTPFKTPTMSSFKRQNSEGENQKLLSPYISPRKEEEMEKSPKPLILTPTGLRVPYIDLSTPQRRLILQSSPIASSVQEMSSEMMESMMTPRCRRPMIIGLHFKENANESICEESNTHSKNKESLNPKFKNYLESKGMELESSLSPSSWNEDEMSESLKCILDGEFPSDDVENVHKKIKKRRSITEQSDGNPLTPSIKSPNSIYFETDL